MEKLAAQVFYMGFNDYIEKLGSVSKVTKAVSGKIRVRHILEEMAKDPLSIPRRLMRGVQAHHFANKKSGVFRGIGDRFGKIKLKRPGKKLTGEAAKKARAAIAAANK